MTLSSADSDGVAIFANKLVIPAKPRIQPLAGERITDGARRRAGIHGIAVWLLAHAAPALAAVMLWREFCELDVAL